jgi:SpoVK/Ycf46/Vps4 family AAA+-type ATPase
MTITNAKQLKDYILKQDDLVEFDTENEKVVYRVATHFLQEVSQNDNDKIFGILGIDKEEFLLQAYGYGVFGGDWPSSKDRDYPALTRACLSLYNLIEPPTTPISSSKKITVKDFSSLIIEDSAKEEIVSVLKQQENTQKIFKDWGLDETLEYGKGMGFLFYGPPGTGKTFGAHCIAKALGKELLVIGPAEIQSSEPGGANRAIQSAFKEAKKQNKILLLDECDSLITKRSDMGMIIAGEINTLLTEIEKFDGIVILSTNRIDTLDEALERRISLIIEFPEPNFEKRFDIWKVLLPKKMPLKKDVDIKKLAEYKLTGGQIKNAILNAARFAAANDQDKVSLDNFTVAIDRINKSKSLMGKKSRFDQRKSDYTKG